MLQPVFETAFSVADMRFASSISTAVNTMVSDGVDAQTALQQVQLDVLNRLAAASARSSEVVSVAPPPTPVVLAPNEISISFATAGNFGQQAVSREWQQAIDDFVAADPEVGEIAFKAEDGFNSNLSNLAQNYDCFYLPSNAVQGADLSQLLSLDPLLSSDPNFDPNSLVGNVLQQVQRSNQTWAMPLSIQPEVMMYNQTDFQNAGATDPYPGWSVTDFENALRTIKISPDDPAPFIPQNTGGTYLMVLLAAYGGLPIDYTTNPVTLQFDNPAAVEAAQQVLDLAREGYIQYENQGGAFGARGLVFRFGNDQDVALYNTLLNSFLLNSQRASTNYQLTTFPEGSQLNAVSYDLGAAYISASTQHPEACYRFISSLAQNPTLFGTMPANRTLLDSPALLSAEGQNAVDYYKGVAGLMTQPNTVAIPTVFSGGIASVGEFLSRWIGSTGPSMTMF